MLQRNEKSTPQREPTASAAHPLRRGAIWHLVLTLTIVFALLVLWWYVQTSSNASPALDKKSSRSASTKDNRESHLQVSRSSTATFEQRAPFTVFTPRTQTRLNKQQQVLDPTQDGWPTEVFSSNVESQLKRLLHGLVDPDDLDLVHLRPLVTQDFRCPPLRPEDLSEVVHEKALSVYRPPNSRIAIRRTPYQGASGLLEALRALAQTLQGASNIHLKIKVVRANITKVPAASTVYLDIHGRTPSGVIQLTSTWDCRWEHNTDKSLKLKSIYVRDYEEIVGRSPQSTWFADCTEAVLGNNDSFKKQLQFGLNHWLKRIETVHVMSIFSACGISVGDVNGDGLHDIYVAQPGGLPNRLFFQNIDGTVTDRSAWSQVNFLDHTASTLFVDLDNDGDQDLLLGTPFFIVILENDATGRFAVRHLLPNRERDVKSLSAADYDNDGDLDVYVCFDFGLTQPGRAPSPFIYHDANNGGTNVLYRNDISDDGWRQFTDVTEEMGLNVHNQRYSLAASWEDYDNDGDMDLYVANDYGQNCLYRNDGTSFVDVAKEAGVVDYGSGMSVSWGDYNNDGRMDLFVGNMFSSAGNRITRQLGFRPETDSATRAILQRFSKGNSLFENVGQGVFREVSDGAGVEMGRWAWSSPFLDLNNDGREDLLVTNGYLTTDDTGDL